jgi:hypothetical protein
MWRVAMSPAIGGVWTGDAPRAGLTFAAFWDVRRDGPTSVHASGSAATRRWVRKDSGRVTLYLEDTDEYRVPQGYYSPILRDGEAYMATDTATGGAHLVWLRDGVMTFPRHSDWAVRYGDWQADDPLVAGSSWAVGAVHTLLTVPAALEDQVSRVVLLTPPGDVVAHGTRTGAGNRKWWFCSNALPAGPRRLQIWVSDVQCLVYILPEVRNNQEMLSLHGALTAKHA